MVVIGDVQLAELRIYQGADLNFDVEWFEGDGTTPIAIQSAEAEVRDAPGGTVLLNITPHITIDATNTNIAHVAIPAAATDAAAPVPRAVWEFNATAVASGEVKRMMRGTARIFAEVTA